MWWWGWEEARVPPGGRPAGDGAGGIGGPALAGLREGGPPAVRVPHLHLRWRSARRQSALQQTVRGCWGLRVYQDVPGCTRVC